MINHASHTTTLIWKRVAPIVQTSCRHLVPVYSGSGYDSRIRESGTTKLRRHLHIIPLCLGLLLSTSLQAAPNVVVSIAPVHSLVAGVMEGVGVPQLLISARQSPHNHALRPSAVKHIYDADLIIWIGADYETTLANVIMQASAHGLTKSLSRSHALKTYPLRTGNLWESAHKHHSEDGNKAVHGAAEHQARHQEKPLSYHQRGVDPHFWLSTANAKIMVNLFRLWLVAIDAEHSDIYQANAERLISKINRLQNRLQQQLIPIATQPYLVFHDAYQYFEKEFNLNPIGSIILNPETPAGVKRIQTFRKMIAANGIKCLFSEPQFQSKLIPILIENSEVRLGQLDPLGSDSQPGSELWFEVMAAMGQSLRDCL